MALRSLLTLLRAEPNMVTLPNNPEECREQARLYAYLASTTEVPESKEHFASLAESWMRLAAEIEGAQILLRALGQIEFGEAQLDEDQYSEAA
jgi:hypothetical protein